MQLSASAIAALFVCEAWISAQARTVRRAGNEFESDLLNTGASNDPDFSTDTSAPIDSGISINNNVPTDSVFSTDTGTPPNQAISMHTVIPGSSDAAYTDDASSGTSLVDPIDNGDPGLSTLGNIAEQPAGGVNDLPLVGMEKVTQKELDILDQAANAVKNGQLEYICIKVKDGHYALDKQSKSPMWDDFANDLRTSGPGYAIHWSVNGNLENGNLVGIINTFNIETWSKDDQRLLGRNAIALFGKIHVIPPMNFITVVQGETLGQLQDKLFPD